MNHRCPKCWRPMMIDLGGSIVWKPYRNRRYGTAFRRSWEDCANRMELRLK